MSNSLPKTMSLVEIKELKSSWIKASYDNVVKRIFDPPRNIDELKVVLCTRFSDLRPLLELDRTTSLKLEFRTQNAYPFMLIDNEVDLISAFYTCNEIQQACLIVKITVDEGLAQQLQVCHQQQL